MSLLEYLRLLVQRGWIVVLCAALTAGVMVLVSSRQTPVYRSTMHVILEPAQASQGVGAANLSLLRSYVVQLHSTEIAAEIVAELGMGITPDELKAGTEISADPDRSLIKIEVNDTSGEWANEVAFAWGRKLVEIRDQWNAERTASQHIIAAPQDFPRFVLYRPRTLVNAMLGGLAGLLAGAVIVYNLEYRRQRVIASRQDLMPIRVLATVPRIQE